MKPKYKKILDYIYERYEDDEDEEDGMEMNEDEAAGCLWNYMQENNISDDDLLSLHDKIIRGKIIVSDLWVWGENGFAGILVGDIRQDQEKDALFKNDTTELIDFSWHGHSAWDYLRDKLTTMKKDTIEERNFYNALSEVLK